MAGRAEECTINKIDNTMEENERTRERRNEQGKIDECREVIKTWECTRLGVRKRDGMLGVICGT